MKNEYDEEQRIFSRMRRAANGRRWAVEIDDEITFHYSRAEAREVAGWHNRHPANSAIRAHGPYRNVDGVARVIDLSD